MANRPIQTPLPADLPQNWTQGQIVAPTGPEAGLSTQHGYNYQSKQINDAQKGINAINAAFDGLVPTSEKGVANGVATLGADKKVPPGQLPDLNYIPTSEKGQPNGVATLDGTGKVPGAQIPGGLADEAVAAHNTSTDPHANMHFFRAEDGELTDPIPVDADTLEGASKATIISDAVAQAGAAGLHLFGPVTVNVPLAGWTGAGPWVQTVSVAGVTAADNGLGVCPVDVADDTARKAYNKAYACLAAEAETVAGGVKLTCRDGKPEISFNVIVKGVR